MHRSSDAYARRGPTPTHKPRGGPCLKSTMPWLFARFDIRRLGTLDGGEAYILGRKFVDEIGPGGAVGLEYLFGGSVDDARLEETFNNAGVCRVAGTKLPEFYEFGLGQDLHGESYWVSYAITESVPCSCSGHPTACKPDISLGLTYNHISHIFPAPVLTLQS